MATTFLKRQKEMKRQEKQREKAERRKQKTFAKRTKDIELSEGVESVANLDAPSDSDSEK